MLSKLQACSFGLLHDFFSCLIITCCGARLRWEKKKENQYFWCYRFIWPLNRPLPDRLLCRHKGYDIAFHNSILKKLNHHVNCSFRNLSGLQYLLENGGVDKFVELIIWAAFIFPKLNLKVLNKIQFCWTIFMHWWLFNSNKIVKWGENDLNLYQNVWQSYITFSMCWSSDFE